MNEIFTPVFIADLKEYIGGVLAKTFKGMFDFDISPINALGRLDNTGEVSAYIELTINNTPTSLCFSIPKSILRDLQHAIHADHLSEETMGLDLTLEIANGVKMKVLKKQIEGFHRHAQGWTWKPCFVGRDLSQICATDQGAAALHLDPADRGSTAKSGNNLQLTSCALSESLGDLLILSIQNRVCFLSYAAPRGSARRSFGAIL